MLLNLTKTHISIAAFSSQISSKTILVSLTFPLMTSKPAAHARLIGNTLPHRLLFLKIQDG